MIPRTVGVETVAKIERCDGGETIDTYHTIDDGVCVGFGRLVFCT